MYVYTVTVITLIKVLFLCVADQGAQYIIVIAPRDINAIVDKTQRTLSSVLYIRFKQTFPTGRMLICINQF